MKNSSKKLLKVLIGLALILFIILNLNLKTILRIFLEANPIYLSLAFFLFFLSHLSIFFRLSYGFSKFHKISRKKVFWSHFFGYLTSLLTPGKLGYLSIAYALKKDIPPSFSTSFLVFCQIISFSVQVILGILGLIYLSTLHLTEREFFLISFSILWLFLSISIVLIFFKFGISKFKFIRKLPKGKEIFNFLKNTNRDFSLAKRTIGIVFSFTLLGWLLSGLAWLFIGLSLRVKLPWFAFIFLNPIVYSLTFVPLTPAGLGIAEAGSVVIFSIFGLKAEEGFLIMILDRAFNSLISLLGLRMLWKKG